MNNVFNIEELFAGRLFVIPDYQRGYAWGVEHWNEFLEDIELLPDGKDHFTGTIVLHKTNRNECTDESGKKYIYYNVVDGQQRLTTIVLLLDAIRHSMAATQKLNPMSSGITSSYLHVNDINNERIYKLTLNRDTNAFFVNNILQDPPGPEGPVIASQHRLREAKRHFRSYLTRCVAQQQNCIQWLLGLHDKVTHRLRLSLYTVDESSEVGVIFEVMNNRGKPLSELEKVKNFLLYVGSKLAIPPHTLADNVNDTWTRVFERMMSADLSSANDEDQLLRMHWLMAYDYRARNFEGSKSIKFNFQLRNFVDRHRDLLASLQSYTKTLSNASLAFCDISKPTHSDSFGALKSDPSTRELIIHASDKLERINVIATFLPLLIAIRLRFPENGKNYLEAVKLCEVFAFRVYRLLEKRSDAGQKTIFRVANELFTGKISFEDAMRQIRRELLIYCSNQQFAESLKADDEDNDWYGWSGLKYMLYEYEEHLAATHTVQLPWHAIAKKSASQTIEHILPQTADDPYWTERFNKTQKKKLLHDLGNLCLTSDNSSYQNKSFPDKKGVPGQNTACYSNSNLFQERELAVSEEWTEDSIRRRREKIVDWALVRWHVDDADSLLEDADDVGDDIDDLDDE